MAIKYLSDSDKDFECLESYLKNDGFGKLEDKRLVFAENETTLFSEAIPEIFKGYLEDEVVTSMVDKLYNTDVSLPTRYDSLSQYHILTGLINKIRESISDLGVSHNYFPHSSIIPTGLVNACAIKLPCSSKEFLLFDSQLFTYCNLFSKAFAICVPISKSDNKGIQLSISIEEVKKQINQNANQCLTRMLDILHSYTILKRPMLAKQYLPPKDYISYVELIRNGMELMIVGHEFGHVNSGHLGNLGINASSMAARVDGISKDHLQEYEADFVGLVLSLQSQARDGYDASLSFIGVDLFFSSMILSERYKSYMSGVKDEHFEEDELESHPTFTNRREFIRSAINDIEGVKEFSAAIRQLTDFYDEVIEHTWNEIVNMIEQNPDYPE